MKIEDLAINYCLTRFNAEYYSDREVYLSHFARVRREIRENSKLSSYPEICSYLDPKVSVRLNLFFLNRNPLQENKEGIEDLESFLEQGIRDVMDLEGYVSGKAVFVKPNLNFVSGEMNPWSITDPRLLLALIVILNKYGAKVLVGEKPGQQRRSADSYRLLRDHFDIPKFVEFIDIDSEKRRETETSTGLVSPHLALPESYLTADFIIDLPKMKTHTLTGVSLGMKNLFGILTDEEKMRHHNKDINPKLVDLLSARPPDLTIVDGLFSLEGQGPLYGTPRNSNLLITGTNCVCVDAVSSYLMGFDPWEIPHIKLAYREGLGDINLRNMRFPAKDPRHTRLHLKRGDLNANPFSQVSIVRGKEIPVGYLNAISHSLERLRYEGRNPRETRIYMGRFQDMVIEEGAIIFGDITADSVNCQSATVIRGHPPRAFELYEMLR